MIPTKRRASAGSDGTAAPASRAGAKASSKDSGRASVTAPRATPAAPPAASARARKPLPPPNFPDALPVSARRDEIAAAIRAHPVVIVCGETGSGKTTQLPKICAMAGCGQRGLIGHTQPRRLAATTVARRIAEELGSPLGAHVGYKIRFNEKFAAGASIKLMTDGILLAETLSDPTLRAYDTLIIDEAHERSLNIDFLLGYLKQLIDGPRRDDLKLIVTSATIDAERFAQHFAIDGRPAPVIEVSGRLYPVQIRYRPLLPSNAPSGAASNGSQRSGAGGAAAGPAADGGSKPGREAGAPGERAAGGPLAASLATGRSGKPRREHDPRDEDPDLAEQIEDAIAELWGEAPGDVLVFLPGEREIRDVAEHLRRAHARAQAQPRHVLGRGDVEILPLFSRLSAAEQDRVFAPSRSSSRRIVLATNVAETSLTVPGIRYVVDTGLARVKRYRYRGKVEQLQIEPISQAAANQRAGRCGRVSDGVCIRLYDEDDLLKRPRFTDPEVLRSSLAAVILRMKALRLQDIEAFPFLDPPPRRAIVDGYDLLHELNAVDEARRLTPVGQQLSRLPVDPRIGRMLLAARDLDCLRELLVIASALSAQDPRERPLASQQAADQQHKRFVDEASDFAGFLKLWDYWQRANADRGVNGESNRRLAARLEREFLSPRKFREWADVHAQLHEAVTDLHWKPNADPAPYERIHQALLTGLLGNLGYKAPEDANYTGTHATHFVLHPGSGLTRKPPRWVMAAEMTDTGRLYARTVARIEPAWIERTGAHLITRSWSDPVWSKKAGQVVAHERGMLYGLTVYAQRRVQFGAKDPVMARDVLIREALVGGDWLDAAEDRDRAARLPFLAHNRRLVAEIERLEHKIRRPDLLVDAQFLYDWFDARVPADVWSGQALEAWYRRAVEQDRDLLKLSRDEVLRKESDGISSEAFPRNLRMRGVDMTLDYHFEPGAADDGVTLTIPLYALNQVDGQRAEWLVPGMLADKVLALLKSLPQKIRRHLVPLPAYVEGFCQRWVGRAGERGLVDALIDDVQQRIAIRPLATDFKLEQVPLHLFMKFKLVDRHGAFIAASRHLAQLRADHGGRAQSAFQSALGELLVPGAGAASASPTRSAEADPAAAAAAAAAGVAAGGGAAGAVGAVGVAGTAGSAVGKVAGRDTACLPKADQRFVDWQFGELPELMELHGLGHTGPHGDSGREGEDSDVDDADDGASGQSMIGYPALIDRGDSVELRVFDEPEQAAREHRGGLRRLFAIALKEPLKFFEKNIPDFTRLALQYTPFGTADELKAELVAALLDRACLAEPLPADEAAFRKRLDEARPRLNLIGQELVRLVAAILAEHAQVSRRLGAAKPHPAAADDVRQQLAELLPARFISRTPAAQIAHLPRYLKALASRLDKIKSDPSRDAERQREMAALQQEYRRLLASRKGWRDDRLDAFGWALQELRVSLFAQELRTPMPVSVKRLERSWAALTAGTR